MARLSARIFGEVARPTTEKSLKVVRIFSELPKHKDRTVVEYYPPYKDLSLTFATLRNYGLFR
jgi:small subunit ribosomal protein S33